MRHTLVTLLAGGHVLLEGVPGLGKTMLVRTLADASTCSFSRIQFTPDLMPADIIGTNLIVEDEPGGAQFQFRAGADLRQPRAGRRDQPGHAQDPVGPARGHAGADRHRGQGHPPAAPSPSSCWPRRTRSRWRAPIPLPEAQLDRFFFKVDVPFPSAEELVEIANRTTGAGPTPGPAGGQRRATIVRHAGTWPRRADRRARDRLRRPPGHGHPPRRPEAPDRAYGSYVRYGASPRGMQALILAGKIQRPARRALQRCLRRPAAGRAPALRHRADPQLRGPGRRDPQDAIIAEMLEQVAPQ